MRQIKIAINRHQSNLWRQNKSTDRSTLRWFSFVNVRFFVLLQLRESNRKANFAKGTSSIWFSLMTCPTAIFT
jgi:hypothetical protein